MRGSRYSVDTDITGGEKILSIDTDGRNKAVLISGIASFVKDNMSSVKNIGSSVYDGLLIIAGEGSTNMTLVQSGDILLGINTAFTGGDFLVMVASQDSPADSSDTTVIDLGTGGAGGSTYELFAATNGQVTFILGTTPDNVDVIIDRIPQIPGTDYNLAGNSVTMTYGQDLGSVVQIRKY